MKTDTLSNSSAGYKLIFSIAFFLENQTFCDEIVDGVQRKWGNDVASGQVQNKVRSSL